MIWPWIRNKLLENWPPIFVSMGNQFAVNLHWSLKLAILSIKASSRTKNYNKTLSWNPPQKKTSCLSYWDRYCFLMSVWVKKHIPVFFPVIKIVHFKQKSSFWPFTAMSAWKMDYFYEINTPAVEIILPELGLVAMRKIIETNSDSQSVISWSLLSGTPHQRFTHLDAWPVEN